MACALFAGALLAVVAEAAPPRFARLGNFEGPVEVQLDPAESWRPAILNLPLPESTRIRTGPAAKLEIELDDASVIRLVGEGLAELSDYTRLSGGQRITVLSVDHGLAYFTGEPGAGNTIHLLVPGAQATLKQGSRIRLQALDSTSEIAVIEGATRFTIPSAEMDLHQGQSARVTIPTSSNFSLFREIAPLEADGWSEQLDKAQAQAPASRLALDRGGKWMTVGDYGTVWQPAPQAGWAPFRQGRWLWYQSIGFTWVGAEPWAWKAYHEGRWLQHPDLGWLWLPAAPNADFSPGAVYWARANNMAAWGPLAPAEQWNGAGPPRQFAAFNITGGTFISGAREILPSSAEDLPKDLLKAFLFTAALPSPPLPAARLTVPREALRTKLFKSVEVAPAVPEITEVVPPTQSEPQPVADAPAPTAPSAPVTLPPVDPDPPDTVYPYPVYTGIVIVNPQDKSDRPRNRKNTPASGVPITTMTPSSGGTTSSGSGSAGSGPHNTGNSPVAHRTPPPESRPERTAPKPTDIHRLETVVKPPAGSQPAGHPPAAPAKVDVAKSQPAPVKVDAPAKVEAPAKVDAPIKAK